jgi:ribonuclease D
MDLITTTSELAAACARLAEHPVITVDTEFLRETTYYPLLCVVQMASPQEAVVIDTLAKGIDLRPFFELMGSEKVLKVFHTRFSIPRSPPWFSVTGIPSPTTSWSSASPAIGPTRPIVSPTGRGAR